MLYHLNRRQQRHQWRRGGISSSVCGKPISGISGSSVSWRSSSGEAYGGVS